MFFIEKCSLIVYLFYDFFIRKRINHSVSSATIRIPKMHKITLRFLPPPILSQMLSTIKIIHGKNVKIKVGSFSIFFSAVRHNN